MTDALTDFLADMLCQLIQFYSDERETLIDIIVKLPADPGPFLFVRLNQPTSNVGHRFFCELSFCDVHARANIASKRTVRVESRHANVQNPTVLSVMSPQPILQLERFSP